MRLRSDARELRNIFAALMEAVKTHLLGQISHALYDVGGEYRRNTLVPNKVQSHFAGSYALALRASAVG